MKGTFLRQRVSLLALTALMFPASAAAEGGLGVVPLAPPVPVAAPQVTATVSADVNVSVPGAIVTTGLGAPPASLTNAARKACKAKTRHACKVVTRTLSQAFTYTDTDMEKPMAVSAPNPCTGVPVSVLGHTKVHMHLTIDSSGGIHQVVVTVDAQGSGVNLVDGGKYSVQERQWQEINLPMPANEMSTDFRLHVVRAGETLKLDDFYMRERVHTTTNANGVVTSDFVDSTGSDLQPYECS
jgi:hypothetical protein